jgi:curved DNA-binding protein CbpA
MTETYENPRAALGLNRAATPDEIKQAYFLRVRQHPPEREPEAFKRIRAAHDQLKTPKKRVEADTRVLEDLPPTRAARARRAS